MPLGVVEYCSFPIPSQDLEYIGGPLEDACHKEKSNCSQGTMLGYKCGRVHYKTMCRAGIWEPEPLVCRGGNESII